MYSKCSCVTGAQALSRQSSWISGKGTGAEPSAVWEVRDGKLTCSPPGVGVLPPKVCTWVSQPDMWQLGRCEGPGIVGQVFMEGGSTEMVLWGKPLGLERGSATHLWGLRAEREGRSKKHAQVGSRGKLQGSRVCLCWEVTDSRKGLCGVGYLLRWGAQCKVLVTMNQELMRGFQDEAGGGP